MDEIPQNIFSMKKLLFFKKDKIIRWGMTMQEQKMKEQTGLHSGLFGHVSHHNK